MLVSANEIERVQSNAHISIITLHTPELGLVTRLGSRSPKRSLGFSGAAPHVHSRRIQAGAPDACRPQESLGSALSSSGATLTRSSCTTRSFEKLRMTLDFPEQEWPSIDARSLGHRLHANHAARIRCKCTLAALIETGPAFLGAIL